MPEHVHLLIWPKEPQYSVSLILQKIKGPTARRAITHLEATHSPMLADLRTMSQSGKVGHHLWQAGGGYDRNLNTAKAIHEALDYIHNNPVRRDLVSQARQWHWSSYCGWYGNDVGPIPVDRTLPTLML
jgi:REP element-mobilizing transposase RayT